MDRLRLRNLVLAGVFVGAAPMLSWGEPETIRARAVIRDASGTEIGLAKFTQESPTDDFPLGNVRVSVRVTGLTPGLHGFHIHANGSCTTSATQFDGAGGHFDPGPFASSVPVDSNHPFHMGDLPNIDANKDGVGKMKSVTSRITLTDGPLSVFDGDGSAVIVHQNQDQGLNGVTGASGGPRVGCGVIELKND